MKKSKSKTPGAEPSVSQNGEGKRSPVSKHGSVPSMSPRVAVVVMAAGKGTRLKSQLPKVLHEVGGKPLLEHVIRAALRVVPGKDVYAIVGHEAERVRAAVDRKSTRL